METTPLGVRAVLQAGGRGQRMGDLTDDTPKPLLPVAGVPMAERLLRQLTGAGVRDVTVITGWLGERIEAHLRGLDGLPDDLRLTFFHETTPLGNAGALQHVAPGDGPVLLTFADLVTDLDRRALVALHRERACDVTLTSHTEGIRLRLGELLVDGDRVHGYLEKPWKDFLICSGIGVFEPRAIDLLAPDRPTGLSELIVTAIEAGLSVTHWKHGAFWMDVNSPAALAEASARLG